MILGAEIALLIMGIMALGKGKLTLTKQRVVYGTPAHLLGLLACTPLPLSFLVGMAYARFKGNVTNPPTDSVRWTLVGIEAAIVLGCLALVYIIGWQFTEAPFDRRVASDPDMPPPESTGKTVMIVLALGVGVFIAVLGATLLLPELAQRLGMGVQSVEASDADIDGLPPEPPTAGPVPEFLLPGATKPAVDRLLQFHRHTLADAYDSVGKRSPQWDEHAHAAMELAARDFSDLTGAKRDSQALQAATQKALDAGCDDALVHYLHYRFAGPKMPEDELERGVAWSAKAMQASAYPHFRRDIALHATMELKARRLVEPGVKKEMTRLADDRLKQLLASARADEPCEDLEAIWFDSTREIYATYLQLGYTPRQSWQHIDKTMSREPKLDATKNTFQAWCNFQWANEEKRGDGGPLTKGQQQKVGEYYAVARDALEKSWQAEPNFATADQFLWAEVQQPRGRAEMEKWFENEMQHRPRLEACYRKLNWLSSKRNGTKEEVLEFGRACRDSKNWECGIPLAVVYAHQMIGDNEPSEHARKNYLRDPEVAADVLWVLAKSRECHPDNVEIHSLYAYYCFRCGHLRRAQRQFELLGDKLWWGEGYPESVMKNARDQNRRATK